MPDRPPKSDAPAAAPGEAELLLDDLKRSLAIAGGRAATASKRRHGASIEKALAAEVLDLRLVDEEELHGMDAAYVARLVYVGSLLALWDLMRTPTEGFREKYLKARVGEAFVSKAMKSKLGMLQIGRSAKDEGLAREISRLHGRIDEIARARAELLNEDRGSAETDQAEGEAEEGDDGAGPAA